MIVGDVVIVDIGVVDIVVGGSGGIVPHCGLDERAAQ